MPINIAGGKSLEECVYYRGGGITVYTDNIVKVRTYGGFYDYFLANQRQSEQIMILPSEEVVKDKEYYDKLVSGLALQYNEQIENAPNLLRNAQVLQDVNTPAPINFGCTVFPDGTIWIGEGYSVGTSDRPPCPVNVPSGKLGFATNATSETHSFVMKEVEVFRVNPRFIVFYQSAGDLYINSNVIGKKDSVLYSKTFKTYGQLQLDEWKPSGAVSASVNIAGVNISQEKAFKQLLIYKGNLTEQELKTELAKDIKLR